MNSRTLILASIAMFGLGMPSAISGPCSTEIEGLAKTLASKDAGSGPTTGAGQTQAPVGSSRQHPPTAVMTQETQGKATSAEDVRRQTQGQPTTAEQGAAGTAFGTDRMDQIHAALQRARSLDGQGKEADCMETVRNAKELIRD
jgi:hypothetical protein